MSKATSWGVGFGAPGRDGAGARWGRGADVALAVVVVATVGMMIVPLPTALLDVLITANIAAAVTLLLVSLYVGEALKIATFPTLLLLTTLFRVAIEVSATRLILVHADAGEVIEAFGRFVVAGNLVVGVVVFLILTLVQFVVVAKGAERVAEVGARFTLDAMPGKQLAIDAALRAGHIDRDEAERRRTRLHRESQFFGAMDGAMKFVKGDALAGVLILAVNLVGGMVIGVFQRQMSFGAAARAYTILTIGEGLVAQIPALILSTAAGVLVTRVSSEDQATALGSEIGRQIRAQPKALGFAAGLLAVMALIPGLPAVPFLVIAAGLGFVAQRLMRAEPPAVPPPPRARQRPDLTLPAAVSVKMGAELADELVGLGDELSACTEAFAHTRGIRVSGVALQTDDSLAPRDFVVALHDVAVAQGTCPVDSLLALTEANRLTPRGVPAVPARLPDGRSACWIPAAIEADLGAQGTVCWPAETVVTEHVRAVLEQHGHELVGLDEAQALLATLEKDHGALVAETVPKAISLATLAEVLRRLAEEKLSLRHLRAVLEVVARAQTPDERRPDALAETSRVALRRAISRAHTNGDGHMAAFALDPVVEETLREAEGRSGLAPALARDVIAGARRAFGAVERPLVLTSGRVRRQTFSLLYTEFPSVTVLSYDELLPDVAVEILGRIGPG